MIKSFTLRREVINESFLPELENYSKRHNVFYGGAGSGKSQFVVQKLIFKLLKFPNRRCLVVRKVQRHVRDSIFELFLMVLSDWKLLDFCQVNKSFLEIRLPNDSVFLFKGLDDPEKIKSITEISDIVIEEATEFNSDDIKQLNLRLRSSKPYTQIHYMFNPISKSNWVYKKWFADGVKIDDQTVIHHSSYKDNKFLSKDYVNSLEGMIKLDKQLYRVYALGEFITLGKIIYPNYKVEYFDKNEIIKSNGNIRPVFGLDFGYTADPTAFIASLHDESNKKIYIYDEFYERGLLNNEIANEIIKRGYRKEEIISDSASPKDIDEIKRLNIPRIKGAKKTFVASGIQYIQQHEIIVHPDCINTIAEIESYSWKMGKDGEYTNVPVDDNDHLMDALRYSLGDRYNSNKIKLFDRRLLDI